MSPLTLFVTYLAVSYLISLSRLIRDADALHMHGDERFWTLLLLPPVIAVGYTVILAVVVAVLWMSAGGDLASGVLFVTASVVYLVCYNGEEPFFNALIRFWEESDRRSAAQRAQEQQLRDIAARQREGEQLTNATMAAQQQLGELTKRSSDALRDVLLRRGGR